MPKNHTRPSPERSTYIVTAGGGARSGKGTSMGALKRRLESVHGQKVACIDQGGKFRAMAYAAMGAPRPVDLDDSKALADFLTSSRGSVLRLLSEIANLTDAERKTLLYTSEVGEASAKVGRVPSSHQIAIGLLRDEVSQAVHQGVDGVIIDGRAMDGYARHFTENGLGRFALGWHFECAPRVAAQRSVKVFGDPSTLDADARQILKDEEARIVARNQTDMQRGIDPLRRPDPVYEVPLSLGGLTIAPHQIAYRALGSDRMAMLDTTHLKLEEMTGVVLSVTAAALQHEGFLPVSVGGIEHIR